MFVLSNQSNGKNQFQGMSAANKAPDFEAVRAAELRKTAHCLITKRELSKLSVGNFISSFIHTTLICLNVSMAVYNVHPLCDAQINMRAFSSEDPLRGDVERLRTGSGVQTGGSFKGERRR